MQKDGESCHSPARTLHQLLSPCVRGMRFHKVWGRWMKTQLVSGGPKWPTQCLAVLWQPWGRNGHSYHSCLWASTVYLRERHPTSVLGGFQDLPGESSEQPGLIPELALLWAEGWTGELPRSLPAWIILLSYEELDSFSGREASQHSLGKWPLAERIQMMFLSSVLHRLFSHFFCMQTHPSTLLCGSEQLQCWFDWSLNIRTFISNFGCSVLRIWLCNSLQYPAPPPHDW